MGRAMVVNAAQLASYSQAKQLILQTGSCDITYNLEISVVDVSCIMGISIQRFIILSGYMKDGKFNLYVQDGIFCHFLASMFSGLVTTIASMPVDIAKTR